MGGLIVPPTGLDPVRNGSPGGSLPLAPCHAEHGISGRERREHSVGALYRHPCQAGKARIIRPGAQRGGNALGPCSRHTRGVSTFDRTKPAGALAPAGFESRSDMRSKHRDFPVLPRFRTESDQFGTMTVSMTWITPLSATMSAMMTRAPSTITAPPPLFRLTRLPCTVLAVPVFTSAAITLAGTTW